MKFKRNTVEDSRRLYNSAQWRRLRADQLQQSPFCEFCAKQGYLIPATIADHKLPHRGDHRLFFDPWNLQSLCKTCHDGAKQVQERSGYLRGSNRNGHPLDPNHHWGAA